MIEIKKMKEGKKEIAQQKDYQEGREVSEMEVGSEGGCHQSSLASKRSRRGTKIIFPDKSGQLLPGKGDPCVGHPVARISAVVRPVLFFRVLFLFICHLFLFPSLSFFLSFVSFSHLSSSRSMLPRATGLSAPIKTRSLTPSTRRVVSN